MSFIYPVSGKSPTWQYQKVVLVASFDPNFWGKSPLAYRVSVSCRTHFRLIFSGQISFGKVSPVSLEILLSLSLSVLDSDISNTSISQGTFLRIEDGRVSKRL